MAAQYTKKLLRILVKLLSQLKSDQGKKLLQRALGRDNFVFPTLKVTTKFHNYEASFSAYIVAAAVLEAKRNTAFEERWLHILHGSIGLVSAVFIYQKQHAYNSLRMNAVA